MIVGLKAKQYGLWFKIDADLSCKLFISNKLKFEIFSKKPQNFNLFLLDIPRTAKYDPFPDGDRAASLITPTPGEPRTYDRTTANNEAAPWRSNC